MEQLNDRVKITVSDEGMGIPEDMKDKVFNRFFRVNNPQLHTFPGWVLVFTSVQVL